ncbi:DUF1963 domain-containing protein [Pseudovibrio ascidiaceicola]|uniref:DUF1963 domain-containing protein n=1 Tax=Pseudovibrio ascidiaceicola TaxID=285279 RepID=UPI000D6880C5|nr:DUF1963 domain-containing protein [Pseudovibrio ascidiaceicola]
MNEEQITEDYLSKNTLPTVFIEHSLHRNASSLTFLGGWPVATPELEWPGDTGEDGKYAHSFLGQINLSDLPTLPYEFSRDGILYFFVLPDGLEDEPEGWYLSQLEQAIKSGDEDKIKEAQTSLDQKPRTVCVVHGPVPTEPIEVHPCKSSLTPSKDSFLFDSELVRRSQSFEDGAYRKVPVELVKGDSFIDPDFPIPEGLPDSIFDAVSECSSAARRSAYTLHFGEEIAQVAFSDSAEQVPLTSILTDLPDWSIVHPISDQPIFESGYDKLDTNVALHWPQTWQMVTEFNHELVERYQRSINLRRYDYWKSKTPTQLTARAKEIEKHFLAQLATLADMATGHQPEELVNESDRQSIRLLISETYREIHLEWHVLMKQNSDKAARTQIGEAKARLFKALRSFKEKREWDSSANVYTRFDMAKRAQLDYETANTTRQSILLSIRHALTKLVSLQHPTVNTYLYQKSQQGLPNHAPHIRAIRRVSSHPHQMFGYGYNVQGAVERRNTANYLMLLQLEGDKEMGFDSLGGSLQIWMRPEDVKAGRWDLAEWNYDCT